MTVADTDVLIDFLAGREPAFTRVQREVATGGLLTTSINRFELLTGAKTTKQQSEIHFVLESIKTLPLDAAAADRAAAVRRRLESQGQGIGFADSLIAGIVLENGATLLTRNLRHFQRVPELLLAGL